MKFSSRVISGRAHGRTIGYPTANLQVTDDVRQVLTKEGVHAVKVLVKDKKYRGALFYGKRSLFLDEKPICEVLLLDFEGNLYGQEVEVEVIRYIRGVVAVKNEEELKGLIEEDIENIRDTLFVSGET